MRVLEGPAHGLSAEKMSFFFFSFFLFLFFLLFFLILFSFFFSFFLLMIWCVSGIRHRFKINSPTSKRTATTIFRSLFHLPIEKKNRRKNCYNRCGWKCWFFFFSPAALTNPAALWGYSAMPRIGMRTRRLHGSRQLHGSRRDAGLGRCGLCAACPFTSPPFAEALLSDVLRTRSWKHRPST